MSWDKRYNYGALAIAILRPDLSGDQAINIISPAVLKQTEENKSINAEIMRMRAERMSYKQIGEVLGLTAGAVWCRVNRQIKRAANKCGQ